MTTMQKLLSTAAVLVALAVPARAECPLDYTAVGPFCVATFAERFGVWATVPYTEGPFMSAYDVDKLPVQHDAHVQDYHAQQLVAGMDLEFNRWPPAEGKPGGIGSDFVASPPVDETITTAAK
jgi:hypothetical protein